MVASAVSSKMLESMANLEGFRFVECLTGRTVALHKNCTFTMTLLQGFKFIGNTALQLVAEGLEVPFGYEEAIGYMFGSQIRDKDGVAATVRPSISLYYVHMPDIFRLLSLNLLLRFMNKVKAFTTIFKNCIKSLLHFLFSQSNVHTHYTTSTKIRVL